MPMHNLIVGVIVWMGHKTQLEISSVLDAKYTNDTINVQYTCAISMQYYITIPCNLNYCAQLFPNKAQS